MNRSENFKVDRYDLKLNQTLRDLEKSVKNSQINQGSKEDVKNIVDMANNPRNDNRELKDYALHQVNNTQFVIRKPTIIANNFEIKPAILNMIQNSMQFN